MGRKKLPDYLVKKTITICLPNWMIQELRKRKGYNKIIEDIIYDYLHNKGNYEEADKDNVDK